MHPRGAVGARLIGGRVPHDGLCAPHPIASAGKSPHPQRHSIQSRRAHFSSRRTLQLNCPVPQIYNPPLPGRYTYLPTYRHRSRGLRWTRTINTTRDWGPCSLWLYTTRCVPGIYNQSINHTIKSYRQAWLVVVASRAWVPPLSWSDPTEGPPDRPRCRVVDGEAPRLFNLLRARWKVE